MLNSRIHDMAKELGKTCIYNFQFAIHVPGRVWGGTAFAKRSGAMKAPVGLLSGSAVCDSRWRGAAPTSTPQQEHFGNLQELEKRSPGWPLFHPGTRTIDFGRWFFCFAGALRDGVVYSAQQIKLWRMTMQKIRTATFEDLDAIAAVEAACFPAAEAATKEEFAGRLTHYADHFWLLFEDEKLVSFVDGFVTDTPDLTDEMYADASLHDAHGAWQMIFGVNTLPEYRKQGLAGQLLRRAIADAKAQGRRGLVLTCKDRLVHYYAGFGFVSEGVSGSTHGGVVWYQMRLTF